MPVHTRAKKAAAKRKAASAKRKSASKAKASAKPKAKDKVAIAGGLTGKTPRRTRKTKAAPA